MTGGSKKRSNFLSVLIVELSSFADHLNVECVREKEVKNNSQDF